MIQDDAGCVEAANVLGPNMIDATSRESAEQAGKQRFRQLLVDIGKDRDENAFSEIYEYFSGRVKSFLMGKGLVEEVAEDLMQEIMLIVWRRAESYDPAKAAASTWIFTIARNRRIDYLRGNSRIEVELDDQLLEIESDLPAQDELAMHWQSTSVLNEALAQLPQEQRQVIHLSYYRGQSHGAISEWLQLPIGTVKSRIRLATQNIRGYVAKQDKEL